MATLAPSPAVCAEKQRLTAVFVEAVHELMELEEREVSALTSGDDGLDAFDSALRHARKRRDTASRLYVLHVRTHGC